MVFAEPCGGTERGGGWCRLSLGFPLKVAEEGGAIKLKFFIFMIGTFFY